MNAYKQFLSSDIIASPFTISKNFTVTDTVVTPQSYGYYELIVNNSNGVVDNDSLSLSYPGASITINPLITFKTTPTNPSESALRSAASSDSDWIDNYIFPALNSNSYISTNFSMSRVGFFRFRFNVINPTVNVSSPFAISFSGSSSPTAIQFNGQNTTIVYTSSSGGFASVGIDRFLGRNITGSLANLGPTTGQISTQYQSLIYNSIKHLYYSNFLTSSYGDSVNRQFIFPGEDENGNVYVGRVDNPNYENYPQTSLSFPKIFPTGSDDIIGVINIPRSLCGERIQPKSFFLTSGSITLYDDGEGNIIDNNDDIVGNIIYSHGVIVLSVDTGSVGSTSIYDTSSYDDISLYGDNNGIQVLNFITSPSVTCSFSSSLTLYETQYKCTIGENEFNMSLNPSLTQEVNGDIILHDFATGSYFSPYITSIGLYNENQDLVAVAKLSQPLPTSALTDMNIIINLDM